MKLLLKLFKVYMPVRLRKYIISELFEITAEAFDSKVPSLEGMSVNETLKEYASFTVQESTEVIEKEVESEIIKNRLYQNAYLLGKRIRDFFNLTTVDDVLATSEIIYQVLGIEFTGSQSGEITINSCYFSSFYSPEICELISSLDEGVAAGLSGGGELTFIQRLTEGKSSCQGYLNLEGD